MPTTIEVEPDVASKIEAQARARGLSVDAYLRALIEGREAASATENAVTPQEKIRLLREFADSHGHDTPLLSDEAISRESIYGERG
jgi:hypothetical protein